MIKIYNLSIFTIVEESCYKLTVEDHLTLFNHMTIDEYHGRSSGRRQAVDRDTRQAVERDTRQAVDRDTRQVVERDTRQAVERDTR